ncbi:MAG TPA: ATP-grasp domain-containing protein [Candidatus Paceibacterota bacterium]|nr:ATP-grasp domain-containing protein [Candidatus Paceibacterota bacterium]
MNTETAAKPRKKIVLIIGLPDYESAFQLTEGWKKRGKKYRYAFLYHQEPSDQEKEAAALFDIAITCDINSDESVEQALWPYKEELAAITVPRFERFIPWFQRLIPFVPHLRTPTVESLSWATSKIEMRKHFAAYNPRITPKFFVAKDATKSTLRAIEQQVGFPVIIKPSGLAASVLVSIAFHTEELEQSLKRIFRKIRAQYRRSGGRGEPQVLVEQFMEGDMYSIDVYVNTSGKIYFCPLVHVTTGRQIGFDDFFGYQRITPTDLVKENVYKARDVSADAIRALTLFNTSVHLELMKTEKGWKIIELGPRVGGFRDFMYRLSYGMHHYANDIAVRAGERPKLSRKTYGHTAVFEFFAKQEGIITNLTGVKKVQELGSFHSMDVNSKIGDRAVFAKNGGKSIFNIFLFSKDRSELLADIRRMEQLIAIETESKPSKK